MLSYSLYIHPTERRLRPFSLSMSPQTSNLTLADRINCAVRKDATWQPTPPPLPPVYAICDFYLLIKYRHRIDIVSNSKNQYRCITSRMWLASDIPLLWLNARHRQGVHKKTSCNLPYMYLVYLWPNFIPLDRVATRPVFAGMSRFLRATAVPPGTAKSRITYGNSVCLSVCPRCHDPVRYQAQGRQRLRVFTIW